MPYQLQGIPAELLQNIANYLPLSSSAVLALSSRFILANWAIPILYSLKKRPFLQLPRVLGPADRLQGYHRYSKNENFF
jgi:hypothetical protein